ncbi:Uncharacterised protein [Burkholderia pseudomallei]|nr:Uncharacterised protein [Burkholderia pseudomallei]
MKLVLTPVNDVLTPVNLADTPVKLTDNPVYDTEMPVKLIEMPTTDVDVPFTDRFKSCAIDVELLRSTVCCMSRSAWIITRSAPRWSSNVI